MIDLHLYAEGPTGFRHYGRVARCLAPEDTGRSRRRSYISSYLGWRTHHSLRERQILRLAGPFFHSRRQLFANAAIATSRVVA